MVFDWKIGAPCTEALWETFTESELAAIKVGDLLEIERKGGQFGLDKSPFALRGRLRSYEYLVRNAVENWSSIGYYIIDEFVNDLSSRDGITRCCDRLEPQLGVRVRAVVQALDKTFWGATEPDDERQILGHTTPELGEWAAGWWWRRVPKTIPWSY